MYTIDLDTLNETFSQLAKQLLKADAAADPAQQDPSNPPALLVDAMQKVFELLRVIQDKQTPDSADSAQGHDIDTLGDYTFNLLADLSSIAGNLKLDELSHDIEALTFPFAIWISRQGGILGTLEPIVNAIAYQANSVREPTELKQLYELTGEVQKAVAPMLQKDLEKTNPGRPWRILLLNRAIVATRSHQPELIEVAYDNLVERLPEEAPRFFREGMQQMVALNYPQPVRSVVEKYYNLWSVERTLH